MRRESHDDEPTGVVQLSTFADEVVELAGMGRRRNDSDEVTAFVDRAALEAGSRARKASPERDITLFGGHAPRLKPDSVTTFAVRVASPPPADDDDGVYTSSAPLPPVARARAAEAHEEEERYEEQPYEEDAYEEDAYEEDQEPEPVETAPPPSRQRHLNPEMETLFAKVPPAPSSRRAPLGSTGATPVRPVEAVLAKRRAPQQNPPDFSVFQPMPSALIQHRDRDAVAPPSYAAPPMPEVAPTFYPPPHGAHNAYGAPPGYPLVQPMDAPRPFPPPESSVRPWIMSGGPSSGFGPPLRPPASRLTASLIATASMGFLAVAMLLGGFLFLRSDRGSSSPQKATESSQTAAVSVAPSETAVLAVPAVPPVVTVVVPEANPNPAPPPPISTPPIGTPPTAALAPPPTAKPSPPPPPVTVATARPATTPPAAPTARAQPQPQSQPASPPKKSAKSVEDILDELGEEQLRR